MTPPTARTKCTHICLLANLRARAAGAERRTRSATRQRSSAWIIGLDLMLDLEREAAERASRAFRVCGTYACCSVCASYGLSPRDRWAELTK